MSMASVAALPMWMQFIQYALKDKPQDNLFQPPGIMSARIDPTTGLRTSIKNKKGISEYFMEPYLPDSDTANEVEASDQSFNTDSNGNSDGNPDNRPSAANNIDASNSDINNPDINNPDANSNNANNPDTNNVDTNSSNGPDTYNSADNSANDNQDSEQTLDQNNEGATD